MLYNFLIAVAAAIVLLGPLIAIHEFGHFWVARRFGIKVITFSIGFGPVLWKKTAKDGVTYQLAAIPLGGYVRMADEREGQVAPEDLPHAFNRQSPWVRMAVVAAGPLVNLLFAFVLFWWLLAQPSEGVSNRVGYIDAQSIAQKAGLQVGDLITHVDGNAVQNNRDLKQALIARVGDSGVIELRVLRSFPPPSPNIPHKTDLATIPLPNVAVKPSMATQVLSVRLPIQHYLKDVRKQSFMHSLGFDTFVALPKAKIGEVMPGSAAALQGLKKGDVIIAANGTPISDWVVLSHMVQANPEKNMQFTVLRAVAEQPMQQLQVTVMPQGKQEGDKTVGVLGVGAAMVSLNYTDIPVAYRQVVDYSWSHAFVEAGQDVWNTSVVTVKSLYKMLTGQISLKNVSGPITTARVAGDMMQVSFEAFIGFMALMSVTLGVMNLLPIPVLDGGHLLYYLTEALRGKPLSQNVQEFGLRLGLVMLGSLMMLALFNDVTGLLDLFNS